MKNRLASLQTKLDVAVKAYREHMDREVTEAEAEAHIKTGETLKSTMDRAAGFVSGERSAIEAERNLAPVRESIEREPSITGGEERSRLDPRGGFGGFQEFVRSVMDAGISRQNGGQVDQRLQPEAAAPTTFGNENVGADGGYLIPPEFGTTVYKHSLDEGNFLPWTSQLPISGNAITFPKDETTPWGTNGVRLRWMGEAETKTQTKPVLGETTLKLRKIAGIVPLTDELIQDSQAAAGYIDMLFGRHLAWKINDAIINGTGGIMPLGIRNSTAIITVAAEGGQAVDTFVALNSTKMVGRLKPMGPNVRWLINHDVWFQIPIMTVGDTPVWTPQAGFKESPYGGLHGVPIVPTQTSQTLGDLGDILLVNFAEYVTISKGPQFATSMHLFFDADATAFRIVFRMDGRPWQENPVTPANGSNTLSPFVQLAAR